MIAKDTSSSDLGENFSLSFVSYFLSLKSFSSTSCPLKCFFFLCLLPSSLLPVCPPPPPPYSSSSSTSTSPSPASTASSSAVSSSTSAFSSLAFSIFLLFSTMRKSLDKYTKPLWRQKDVTLLVGVTGTAVGSHGLTLAAGSGWHPTVTHCLGIFNQETICTWLQAARYFLDIIESLYMVLHLSHF